MPGNNNTVVVLAGFHDHRFGRARRGQTLTGVTDDTLRELVSRGLVKPAGPAAGAPPAGQADKGPPVLNKAAPPVANKAAVVAPKAPVKG